MRTTITIGNLVIITQQHYTCTVSLSSRINCVHLLYSTRDHNDWTKFSYRNTYVHAEVCTISDVSPLPAYANIALTPHLHHSTTSYDSIHIHVYNNNQTIRESTHTAQFKLQPQSLHTPLPTYLRGTKPQPLSIPTFAILFNAIPRSVKPSSMPTRALCA